MHKQKKQTHSQNKNVKTKKRKYANVTSASDGNQNDINLLKYIEPGYGLGLRINISKKARTNIGIDYGWGSYGSKGLFLRLNENF